MNLKSNFSLKRPNLYVIKQIVEEIRDAGIVASFAMLSLVVSNKKEFCAYLRLLESLGWVKHGRQEFPWSQVLYELTDKGKTFLALFSKDEVTET